jgi:hypothetical protein
MGLDTESTCLSKQLPALRFRPGRSTTNSVAFYLWTKLEGRQQQTALDLELPPREPHPSKNSHSGSMERSTIRQTFMMLVGVIARLERKRILEWTKRRDRGAGGASLRAETPDRNDVRRLTATTTSSVVRRPKPHAHDETADHLRTGSRSIYPEE